MFTKSKFHKLVTIIIMLAMLFSVIQPSIVSAQGGDWSKHPAKSAQDDDGIKRQVNAQTGRVSLIGPERTRAACIQGFGHIRHSTGPGDGISKSVRAEFGLKDPARDLSEMKAVRSEAGRVTVRYQQEYNGVPVMGGELIVNTNERGDLYSMNGEVSVDLSLPTAPTID